MRLLRRRRLTIGRIERRLGRKLDTAELALIERARRFGQRDRKIVAYLKTRIPQPSDEELPVRRYEVVGEDVRDITDIPVDG